MQNNYLIAMVVGILGIAVLGYIAMTGSNTPSTPNESNTIETESMQETQTSEMMDDVEVKEEETIASNTIVDIAVSNPDFSTLVAAVKAAGLVETLSGDTQLTVFAPTNAAFEKLPAGTVEALLNDKEKLTQILTYHVVPGKVMASDVVSLKEATTVQGQKVKVTVMDGKVKINESNVVTTDIEASNGVIHVIDTVLLPK